MSLCYFPINAQGCSVPSQSPRKAITGKAAGSIQKALDVDDTSPIALLALEGPLLAQP